MKKFIDLIAAPTAFSYTKLFPGMQTTKPTSAAPTPAPWANMTREEFLVEAWKKNILCRNVMESPGSRSDLTTLTKAVAREQRCDFNEALETVLNGMEYLPEDALREFSASSQEESPRAETLRDAWNKSALPRDYWLESGRNDLTILAKSLATERQCTFGDAVSVVLDGSPNLSTEGDK